MQLLEDDHTISGRRNDLHSDDFMAWVDDHRWIRQICQYRVFLSFASSIFPCMHWRAGLLTIQTRIKYPCLLKKRSDLTFLSSGTRDNRLCFGIESHNTQE